MNPPTWRNDLIRGLVLGLISALCIWGVMVSWLLINRMRVPSSNSTVSSFVTPSVIPSPTHLQPTRQVAIVTVLPSTPLPEVLRLAERAYLEKRLGNVKAILLPGLSSLQTPADLAHAYRLLGDAEWQQGHYQLAAGYYEGLYQNEPTLENLYLLAQAYDAGGSLEAAYQKYLLLTSSDDSFLEEYRPIIEQRLEHLTEVLRVRHKGTLPAPLPTLTPQTVR